MKTSVPTIPRQLKKGRTPFVSEFGHLPSTVDKALTDPGTIRLPALTLRDKARTVSFTLNAADGYPRVGVADDKVNLLMPFH